MNSPIGAAGYILIGITPLLFGKKFLENIIPLAETGKILSGGTIPLISLLTGLEVAGGFVLLLSAFLQKTLSADDGEENLSDRE